jgi:hypothetical protein
MRFIMLQSRTARLIGAAALLLSRAVAGIMEAGNQAGSRLGSHRLAST